MNRVYILRVTEWQPMTLVVGSTDPRIEGHKDGARGRINYSAAHCLASNDAYEQRMTTTVTSVTAFFARKGIRDRLDMSAS